MLELIKQKEKQFPKLFEIIRFLIMGVVATLIDMFVMAVVMYLPCMKEFGSFIKVFTSKDIAPVWLSVIGTSAGFLVSVVVNYFLSLWFVYEGENKQAKTKKGVVLFFVLSAVGLGIQSLGMFLGCTLLKLNEFVIKIILICVVLVFNYITRKIFIFKGEKNQTKTQIVKTQADENETSTEFSTLTEQTTKIETVNEIKMQAENETKTQNIKTQTAEKEKTIEQTKPKLIAGKFQLIANAITILSGCCLFFALTSSIDNSILNLILKVGCFAVWLVVMLMFMFIFNQNFCLNSFKSLLGKTKNEICVSVLTCLFAVMFVGCTIYYINKSVLNVLLVLGALPILLIAFVRVWQFIVKRATAFIKSLTKSEILFIVIGFAIATILIVVADVQTGMLLGKNYEGDFRWYEIYSFDTNLCFNRNIFNNPFSNANNYKHLMLSFVVLPFTLLPNVLFSILHLSIGYAAFVQLFNAIILLVSIVILKRLLKFNNVVNEIAFYLIMFFAASCLFNVLVYEKFVVGFFFCVLTVNAIVKKDNAKYFYYLLASFSLTLNLALLPFVVLGKGKTIKDALKETITLAAIFVGIACLFGQVNHAIDLLLSGIKTPTGDYNFNNSSFADTTIKYFSMFTQFWVLPTIKTDYPHILSAIPQVKSFYFIVGIIIFAIAILGFVFNRKNKFIQVCFYWFWVVFALTLVARWGAIKNEMFLYSLAYVWAIIPLVFAGLKGILKNKYLLLTAICLIAITISIRNVQILHSILSVAHCWFKI